MIDQNIDWSTDEKSVKDVDWSKPDKPVKFGDDVVAEENYCWGLGRPPLVACGWKWPFNVEKTRPSHFLSDWTRTIRDLSTWRSFVAIKGPNDKIKMLSFMAVP